MSALRQRAALTYDLPVLPNLDLHTELFTQRRDFEGVPPRGHRR
jgi:hypothetical protein